ncbi:glycosyltransferase family 2 protein [uncultured Thermanaerothrix sp.]|uniref:glycosyltransferase family 2 protein n=1 Tax=uncultured Thermanaerothrix sp. TaxID=1195149 RepID=UPI002614D9EF|nr:glycosyltransferase family 2 protein [uncultured Thermanaerothrix sp.]
MRSVSVIVPCYNEEAHIRFLLEALVQQTYPLDHLEVIIADGMSTDHTREVIAQFAQAHPELRIRLVDNPKRIIPAALNAGLAVARGDFIVRLDAHSIPAPDYIARCVSDLQADLGDNVGGIWIIRPARPDWIARSIAIAAAHPLGVGDARYRHGRTPGLVDTVPFGAFRRELFEQVGGFDETLLTNEDYEFNARLRGQGKRVYLDPQIRSEYIARPTLGALARQYWRYGYWKFQMLRRYPKTLRWRQALPPMFVLGILGLVALVPFWSRAVYILGGILAMYIGALSLGALSIAWRARDAHYLIGVPLAIATMHFAWGMGFLWSLLTWLLGRKT